MYFLLEACQHPSVLRVISFLFILLDIVFVIIPIVLIIMLMIDFGKAVVTSKEEDIKNTKLVAKRILYALIIFSIPWVINVLMIVISYIGYDVDYMACINNAKAGDFGYYDDLFEAENNKIKEEVEEQTNEEMKNNNSDDSYEDSSDDSDDNEENNSSNYSGSNLASGNTYSEAARAMMDMARTQEGNTGDDYNAGGNPWCAIFVVYNLKNTTIKNIGSVYDVITKEGKPFSDNYAGATIRNFVNHSNLSFYYSKHYDGNYVPKTGDLIYFWYPGRNGNKDWNKDLVAAETKTDHVGLVDYVDESGFVHTVEGNSGGKVIITRYNQDNGNIMGYGSWYK